MKRKPPTDLGASVRERLRQLAGGRGQELQLVLTRYGVNPDKPYILFVGALATLLSFANQVVKFIPIEDHSRPGIEVRTEEPGPPRLPRRPNGAGSSSPSPTATDWSRPTR